MHDFKSGDRIYSRRHHGELVVAVAGRRTLICNKRKVDGSKSRQEVVVALEDVAGARLNLPLKASS